MTDEDSKRYQTSEPWLEKSRFPYMIPHIVVHRVPDVAPEPVVGSQKEFLAAPPRCYKRGQRKEQSIA